MAKYESKYAELMFYVDEKAHVFKDGKLVTEDKAVMAVLDKIADVVRVEQPKAEPEEKPAKKAPAKKK